MDMNVLSGQEELNFHSPPSDHSHTYSHSLNGHGGNDGQHSLHQQQQQQQHHDFFNSAPPFDMAAFPATPSNPTIAANPSTSGSYQPHFPSPLHQQQHPQQQATHDLQHQRPSPLHMDGSPSAVGSGSGVSDLEDVEEEDEGETAAADTNEQEGRGRKGVRERFAEHQTVTTLPGPSAGRKARNQSISRGPRGSAPMPVSASMGVDDAMNVDDRQ